MKVHRKDFHSRRGLEAALAQRRKLLTYLRTNDFDIYAVLLTRLGLKDNYEKQVRYGLSVVCSRDWMPTHVQFEGVN